MPTFILNTIIIPPKLQLFKKAFNFAPYFTIKSIAGHEYEEINQDAYHNPGYLGN